MSVQSAETRVLPSLWLRGVFHSGTKFACLREPVHYHQGHSNSLGARQAVDEVQGNV